MAQPIEGYFEDFEDGATITTARRTITEADIVNFAGVSGDYNPIHTDAVHAEETVFGERIAHGLLVLSIASGLMTGIGSLGEKIQAFTTLDWKFRAPVLIGDTIQVEAQVANLRPMRRMGGGFVTLALQVVKQDGSTVQKGEWQLLIKSREADQQRDAQQPES